MLSSAKMLIQSFTSLLLSPFLYMSCLLKCFVTAYSGNFRCCPEPWHFKTILMVVHEICLAFLTANFLLLISTVNKHVVLPWNMESVIVNIDC